MLSKRVKQFIIFRSNDRKQNILIRTFWTRGYFPETKLWKPKYNNYNKYSIIM